MGLQGIFQYDRMRDRVDADTFGYLLRASVDLCIVSTATYLPIIAIEVDSPWHDSERQQARDARKDEIFRVGGVGLLRLRVFGSATQETVRAELHRVLQENGNLHTSDQRFRELLAQLERRSP